MKQIQAVHSGTYQVPDGLRLIVLSIDMAEALDNLLEVCDDVVHGHSHDMDIGPALDRVRRLHDWRSVRLGGETVAQEED